jgi:hypothetical protein
MMAVIAGCGGSGGRVPPPLEDPSNCSGGWQALTAPLPFDSTSPLVYHDGTLYYSAYTPQSLMALSTAGGAPTAVAQGFALEVWVEGDHLLFTGGNLGNQIFSLPFAGGTPTLVLDGGAGRSTPGVALHHAFTASDFYWAEMSTSSLSAPSSIWHQPRSAGTPTQFGSVTLTDPGTAEVLPVEAVALANDRLLVASGLGSAYAVPLDGSAATPLAAPDQPAANTATLAGIDGSGAYWAVDSADQFRIVVSPADGMAARVFWQPVTASVAYMWPDGTGGWIAVGIDTFGDGHQHTVMWTVDGQGTATRLGCSPGDQQTAWIALGVAIAPDAIYAITQNLQATTWEIDRIAR